MRCTSSVALIIILLTSAANAFEAGLGRSNSGKQWLEVDFQGDEPLFRYYEAGAPGVFLPLNKEVTTPLDDAKHVAVAISHDGTGHVFAIDRKGDLHHAMRKPDGKWIGWVNASEKLKILDSPLIEVRASADYRFTNAMGAVEKSEGHVLFSAHTQGSEKEIEGQMFRGSDWTLIRQIPMPKASIDSLEMHRRNRIDRGLDKIYDYGQKDEHGRQFWRFRNLTWKDIYVSGPIVFTPGNIGSPEDEKTFDIINLRIKPKAEAVICPIRDQKQNILLTYKLAVRFDPSSPKADTPSISHDTAQAPTAPVAAGARGEVSVEARPKQSAVGVTEYFVRNGGSRTIVATIRTSSKSGIAPFSPQEHVQELRILAGQSAFIGNDGGSFSGSYQVTITGARYD